MITILCLTKILSLNVVLNLAVEVRMIRKMSLLPKLLHIISRQYICLDVLLLAL